MLRHSEVLQLSMVKWFLYSKQMSYMYLFSLFAKTFLEF
jgi:hypothetical protein